MYVVDLQYLLKKDEVFNCMVRQCSVVTWGSLSQYRCRHLGFPVSVSVVLYLCLLQLLRLCGVTASSARQLAFLRQRSTRWLTYQNSEKNC